MSALGRVSWEVGLDIPGFEGMVLTSKQIREEVHETSQLMMNALAQSYDLDGPTQDGLRDLFANMHCKYKEGPEQDETTLQLGTVALSGEGVDSTCVRNKEFGKRVIFLTGDSIREEIGNIHAASQDYSNTTGQDEYSSDCEAEIYAFTEDRATMLSVALKMVTARRLLRYGVFPKDLLKSPEQKSLGFAQWMKEYIPARSKEFSITPAQLKKLKVPLEEKYRDGHYAVKSLRRTTWPHILHTILPFNPDVNHIFTAVYVQQIAGNNRFTPTFHEEMTVKLSPEEVATTLKNVYAPQSVGLKLV